MYNPIYGMYNPIYGMYNPIYGMYNPIEITSFLTNSYDH